MLVLYTSSISANSVDVVYDTGIISLNIINRPPLITDIRFNPETAFEDSTLECIATVNDEDPEETKLIYKWYMNNELVEITDNHLTGFNANDLVICEVIPVDIEGVRGEAKSAFITINKKSAFSTITGFIVKNPKNNFFTFLNFLF